MKPVRLAPVRPLLPDRVPPETVPCGSITAELAARDARIAALESDNAALRRELALAQGVLVAMRSTRGDQDDCIERIGARLAPTVKEGR